MDRIHLQLVKCKKCGKIFCYTLDPEDADIIKSKFRMFGERVEVFYDLRCPFCKEVKGYTIVSDSHSDVLFEIEISDNISITVSGAMRLVRR